MGEGAEQRSATTAQAQNDAARSPETDVVGASHISRKAANSRRAGMAISKRQKMLFFKGVNGEVIENKRPEKIRTGIQRRSAVGRAGPQCITD